MSGKCLPSLLYYLFISLSYFLKIGAFQEFTYLSHHLKVPEAAGCPGQSERTEWQKAQSSAGLVLTTRLESLITQQSDGGPGATRDSF